MCYCRSLSLFSVSVLAVGCFPACCSEDNCNRALDKHEKWVTVEGAEGNSGREKLPGVASVDAPIISSHQDASVGRGRRGLGKGRWRMLMTHSSSETNDLLIREQLT